MILTATETEVYEAGVYEFSVQGITPKSAKIVDPDTNEIKDSTYLRWVFDIMEEGYEGKVIGANTSTSFGPKAKARAWAEALLARSLHPNEPVDTDDLAGLHAMGTVAVVEKNGKKYNEITALAPRRRKAPQAPAQRPAAAPQATPEPAVTLEPDDFWPEAPEATNSVTEKQVKAIYAIGRASARLSESQVDDLAVEYFGIRPVEMTRVEASQFIDRLKGQAA